MSDAVGIVVVGAAGRLGKNVLEVAGADVVGVVHRDAGWFGPKGAVRGTQLADVLAQLSTRKNLVVVDVTTAGSTPAHARACATAGVPLLVATTGLSADDHAALAAASAQVAVLAASNLSVGAHLVAKLAQEAGQVLPDADVEIVELHHNQKKDAPSGTALMLARAVSVDAKLTTSRSGASLREQGEIGVFGVRGGDVVGEHTVYFFVDGERVELTHRVSDRRVFAVGALRAARFLAGKSPGLFQMADVIASTL